MVVICTWSPVDFITFEEEVAVPDPVVTLSRQSSDSKDGADKSVTLSFSVNTLSTDSLIFTSDTPDFLEFVAGVDFAVTADVFLDSFLVFVAESVAEATASLLDFFTLDGQFPVGFLCSFAFTDELLLLAAFFTNATFCLHSFLSMALFFLCPSDLATAEAATTASATACVVSQLPGSFEFEAKPTESNFGTSMLVVQEDKPLVMVLSMLVGRMFIQLLCALVVDLNLASTSERTTFRWRAIVSLARSLPVAVALALSTPDRDILDDPVLRFWRSRCVALAAFNDAGFIRPPRHTVDAGNLPLPTRRGMMS
jgi:hypothetical protein